ncbi:MAG: PriCT-2 domain-containing protein, partial [Selenomonadaceae bacterium]|nr:PriCT-2 domain-containing protein [Selenomonadaceae bacterium]
IFDSPIKITDDNREELKRRNNLLLDVIRQRANGKKIDGVGDLPRILRTPGTFNYKLGKDNAPLCHIVEDSGLRFSPNELDERMKVLIQPQLPKSQVTNSPPKTFKKDFPDDKDFNIFCVRRMLDFILPSSLTYDDWLAVGMALKNSGFDCSDWEIWSRADECFKDGECESKWNGFNRDGYGIGTIYMFAQQNGYDAKETYREWYDLHPDLKPSHKRNMDEENKRELDNAIIWLDTLEPENFTAADAHSFENIHSVALATVFGFSAKAEKFFKTIKDAKAIAKNRIKESDADLTKKLSDDERNELTALVEGISVDSIRRTVDREITAVTRARDQFLREAKKQAHRIEIQRKREEKEARAVEAKSRLDQLRAMPSSPERDAEMIELIRESCDWHCNKQGGRESVKSTVANIDKIFTYDPYLDGLFGYDEFNQVDVFLKAPPWNKEKKGTELTDRDDSQLQMYIRRTYTEFANEKLTLQAVPAYSDAHRFHVIKDFFHSLPTWDGKPRAEKLFVK